MGRHNISDEPFHRHDKTGIPAVLPRWLPTSACHYLEHTEMGHSIREIARRSQCHPSTVLRQVRRWEGLRDDILIDEALRKQGQRIGRAAALNKRKDTKTMATNPGVESMEIDPERFAQDALRILRRMTEPGAVLAVASDMDKGVVVRDVDCGTTTRTAVVDRPMAQALAMKDWISCSEPGRVARYRITSQGRTALSRMIAEAENAARVEAQGFAEAQAPFSAGREVRPTAGGAERSRGAPARPKGQRQRFMMGESPLTALARRRDKDGVPFLEHDLVAAGERLREDFELSQMGARVTQNWEGFLTGGIDRGFGAGASYGGSQEASDRVAAALSDLGPGLGDVVLRCCCYLEGLEQTEKSMGWSARSGKIVLRIALQRLKRHYENMGDQGGMIG